MTGKTLKKRLIDMGCGNLSELSRMLGMASVQNLHSSLSAQDVRSGLIEDIAKVLNRDISDFYPAHHIAHYEITDSPVAVAGDINGNNASVSNNNISERFVGLLEKKDEQIDRLLNIIETLNH